MCVVLMLLAIPLGFVNPRAGASANLILALLIFFTYLNLTKVRRTAVKQAKLGFGMAWWPLHLFACCWPRSALFAWRLNVHHRWHPLLLAGRLEAPPPAAKRQREGGRAMKILRALLLRQHRAGRRLRAGGLPGLAAFMDLTGELPAVGKGGYMIQHALLYVLLLVPGNMYRVMPVAALIGTIYTMAQFAQSSEFTIMRASSMSTRMAAWMLFKIGIVFVVITFIFGELVTPRTAPLAERVRLSAKGATLSAEFRSGMWTKDTVHMGGQKGPVTGSRFFNARQIRRTASWSTCACTSSTTACACAP
jgi:lipopolysaccharide export LptBFGC system permease protein LptF